MSCFCTDIVRTGLPCISCFSSYRQSLIPWRFTLLHNPEQQLLPLPLGYIGFNTSYASLCGYGMHFKSQGDSSGYCRAGQKISLSLNAVVLINNGKLISNIYGKNRGISKHTGKAKSCFRQKGAPATHNFFYLYSLPV